MPSATKVKSNVQANDWRMAPSSASPAETYERPSGSFSETVWWNFFPRQRIAVNAKNFSGKPMFCIVT
ncbi:MAG: hypothetical protein K0R27_1222 [Xanthobacteraceae bacterium]|jgi:hypothetical protein|nr:hypothetical protein [Xanthobacteraceae bacterium]